MAPAISQLFSAADLDRIKAAINDAEKRTSGEIAPPLWSSATTMSLRNGVAGPCSPS